MKGASRGALLAAMMIAAHAGRTGVPASPVSDPMLTNNQSNMLSSFRGASGGSRNSKTAARRKARNRVALRAMRRRRRA